MAPVFPRIRWAALLWLAVWLPAYGHVWGWANFLHLCDIAVVLTCLGLWRGDALLISSQAVSSILPDLAWCVDVAWRLFFGRHLVGGTEYMWDAHFPLWVRLLSLFHLVLPALLLWAVRRAGYDRRGWLVQSAFSVLLLGVSRLFGPALNLNYAYQDPFFHRAWGPAPVHLAVIFWGMIALVYWPTHLALAKILPNRG
jgi:hypothetical protein